MSIFKKGKILLFTELLLLIASIVGLILYKISNMEVGMKIFVYGMLGLAALYSLKAILPPPVNKRLKEGGLGGSYIFNFMVYITLALGINGILFSIMHWPYAREITIYASIPMMAALALIWLLRPVNNEELGGIDGDRIRLALALFISAFFLY